MAYLGIDLRTSTKHPSAVSLIDASAQVSIIGSFRSDTELLALVEQYQPSLIAMGTPLGLPAGLCCLEASCPCALARPQQKGRQSELEMARMGISCFFTNKGSIIRRLIYRAIGLKEQLAEAGYAMIEVYPHATKVVLFGDSVPPKNSPRSLAFMKERLPTLMDGLADSLNNLDRYACDALINAHTARLHARKDTDLLGIPEESLVALPKLIPSD